MDVLALVEIKVNHVDKVNFTMFCAGATSTRNALHRRTMEDTYVIKRDLAKKGDGLFALFDGHGGDKCSKWCAENMYRLLADMMNRFDELLDIDEILSVLLAETDKLLDKEFGSKISNVGCTATILYLDADTSCLYSANIGDSKMILYCRGNIEVLTMCHNTENASERKRIKESGGKILFGRVAGCLAVTRALGDTAMKPYISPLPYTTKMILEPSEEEFIIAASDGLWDAISENEAVNIAKRNQDCGMASKLLMKQAIKRGSRDNITCIVIRLFPGPTAYTCDQSPARMSVRLERENVNLSKRKLRHVI